MTPLGYHLTHLETSGLIRLAQLEPELEYIFRHALVQDAAYQSMLLTDRKKLHHTVGEALEQLYSARLDELAPVLAHHFALAEDETQALAYYMLAGDVASRSYANAEVIKHYTHALEITRHTPGILDSHQLADLYTKLGRTHEIDGDYGQALIAYTELESLAQSRDDPILMLAALMARATVHAAPTGKYNVPLAQELCHQALPIARDLQDYEAEAKIHWSLMLSYMFTENTRQAIQNGEISLSIAREHNLREREAYVLHDLGGVYITRGQINRCIANMQAAETIWREIDNKPMLADTLSTLAFAHFCIGDYPRSAAYAGEGLEFSRKINNLWNQSYSQFTLGPLYLDLGHFSQAIDIMKNCITLGNQAGFSVPNVETATYLSYAYGILLGDLEQGFEWANHVLDYIEERHGQWVSQAYMLLAWLHTIRGDLAQAIEFHQKGWSTFDLETGYRPSAHLVLLANVAIPLARQDYAQTMTAADHMIAALSERGARPFLSDALYYRAQALLALNKPGEAHTTLIEARREAEARNSRRSLWFILAALSELEHQRGNPTEAAKLHQQACETIDYIAEHIHQPNLRAAFLDRPDVRAVMEITN